MLQTFTKEHHSIFTRLNNDYLLVKISDSEVITAPFHEVCERLRGEIIPLQNEETRESGWVCKIGFSQYKEDELAACSYSFFTKDKLASEAVLHKVLSGLKSGAQSNMTDALGQAVGASHPTVFGRIYKGVTIFTKFALGLTALAVAFCAVVLVLPLGATSQSSPTQNSLNQAATNLSSSITTSPAAQAQLKTVNPGRLVKTDGYLPEKQLNNMRVLAGYAGIGFNSEKMATNPSADDLTLPSFFLFSSLKCPECGPIENMLRSAGQKQRGYIMPVGMDHDQTILALSHTYCSDTPFKVWEQFRIHRPDVMDVKGCEGWDERAKAASFAEIMITASVNGNVAELQKAVIVAPNGAYHIGGFSDDTTVSDLAEWLKQNASKG